VDAFFYKLMHNFNLFGSIYAYTRLPSYDFPFRFNNTQKRHYSSGSKLSKCTPPLIEPWFVTGFTDKKGIKQFSTKRRSTNNNLTNSVVV